MAVNGRSTIRGAQNFLVGECGQVVVFGWANRRFLLGSNGEARRCPLRAVRGNSGVLKELFNGNTGALTTSSRTAENF